MFPQEGYFNWTTEAKAKLRSLWDQGATGQEIAVTMGGGLSRSAVIGMANRMGLEARQARINPLAAANKRPRVKAAVKPKAAPVPRPETTPPLALSSAEEFPATSGGSRHWLTRKPWECPYPVSGAGHATYSCCAPMSERAPYCDAHARLCYSGYFVKKVA